MAEFKINKALTDEITSVRESCNLINGSYTTISPDDVRMLQAARIIIAKHDRIKTLLDLYKALVLRDAQDLYNLVEEATLMDTRIAEATGGSLGDGYGL